MVICNKLGSNVDYQHVIWGRFNISQILKKLSLILGFPRCFESESIHSSDEMLCLIQTILSDYCVSAYEFPWAERNKDCPCGSGVKFKYCCR